MPIPGYLAVLLLPDHPHGGVVLLHGYGGCKEEQLGLAWRLAELGFATCAIDLRGHGEHPAPMDLDMPRNVEAAIAHCRQYGPVTAIGHSLGGRLALLSSAEYGIGISPSLDREYGERTRTMLHNMRSYRVAAASFELLFDIQAALPVWQPAAARPSLVLYGERNVPEIYAACSALANTPQHPVRAISQALHSDIFLLEETIQCIQEQLRDWYGF